jgi:hypothetical protein
MAPGSRAVMRPKNGNLPPIKNASIPCFQSLAEISNRGTVDQIAKPSA